MESGLSFLFCYGALERTHLRMEALGFGSGSAQIAAAIAVVIAAA